MGLKFMFQQGFEMREMRAESTEALVAGENKNTGRSAPRAASGTFSVGPPAPHSSLGMNRSAYDQDVATWSPQGNLFQVEYAQETVKLGSAALGVVNKNYVVLAALKRSHSELSTHQEKIFEIDEDKGIAISGLTSDARSLATYMRDECINHRYAHGTSMVTGRLVAKVAGRHHARTIESSRRPYGVGLLVAGCDRDGPHLYETEPSGVFSEYRAFAIGSRAQSARTYFERNADLFADAPLDELVTHALRALQGSASDTPLTVANTQLSIVGRGQKFEIWSEAKLAPFIEAIRAERAASAAPAAGAAGAAPTLPAATAAPEDEEMEME